MSSLVSAAVAVYLGLPSHQDVRPNFLPFAPTQPPSVEELTRHLQEQPGIEQFLTKYQQALEKSKKEVVEPHETSRRIATLAALPYLQFVEDQSRSIMGKVKVIALDKLDRVLLVVFPWEMYGYFVPKFQWIGSRTMDWVRWYKERNRDKMAEGGFLTRLEQDDFFSAGRFAHQKAQYFCQALVRSMQMRIFAQHYDEFKQLVPPMSGGVQHFQDEYKKWHRRRASLYQMSYTTLRVRQMQVALKLSLDLTDDPYKLACRRARITFYEHWLNATHSAFYNRTMGEKGLSYLEWAGDKVLDVLDGIGTYFGLQDPSQKPPPFGDCRKTLESALTSDQQDLKTEWAKLTSTPESWDLDAWVLKPANEFEKQHEEKDKKVTPDGFLVQLLTIDHSLTAELLCHAMSNIIPKPPVWPEQGKVIQKYNQLLNQLFNSQKELDVVTLQIIEAMSAKKDKIEQKDLMEFNAQLSRCQGLSQDLYNGIVCLKGSLLKTVLGNFDQQYKGLSTRILNNIARKTFFIITEGALQTDLPDFDTMSREVNQVLSHVNGALKTFNGEVDEGFVVLNSSADTPESPVLTDTPQSWVSFLSQSVISLRGSRSPSSARLEEEVFN
jgi:hypothetical protein